MEKGEVPLLTFSSATSLLIWLKFPQDNNTNCFIELIAFLKIPDAKRDYANNKSYYFTVQNAPQLNVLENFDLDCGVIGRTCGTFGT